MSIAALGRANEEINNAAGEFIDIDLAVFKNFNCNFTLKSYME